VRRLKIEIVEDGEIVAVIWTIDRRPVPTC
jgi:hypothetical protein